MPSEVNRRHNSSVAKLIPPSNKFNKRPSGGRGFADRCVVTCCGGFPSTSFTQSMRSRLTSLHSPTIGGVRDSGPLEPSDSGRRVRSKETLSICADAVRSHKPHPLQALKSLEAFSARGRISNIGLNIRSVIDLVIVDNRSYRRYGAMRVKMAT
jgi:hypothetical protein